MPGTDPLTEERRKHLEFVQAVIARQAGNSFLVKGWALTVATAVYGYAASKDKWAVALVGSVAVLAFWYIDGFYLRQERLYRCLYKGVVAAGFGPPPRPPEPALYSMDASGYGSDPGNGRRQVLWSDPLRVYFGALVVAGLVVALATGCTQPENKDDRSKDASASSSSPGVG